MKRELTAAEHSSIMRRLRGMVDNFGPELDSLDTCSEVGLEVTLVGRDGRDLVLTIGVRDAKPGETP